MSQLPEGRLGTVASLWRYPVKSMIGEELDDVDVDDRGLLGDRCYALVDHADGKVASAKNPRKWPRMFEFRATFVSPPRREATMPPVLVTFPDGQVHRSDDTAVDRLFSEVLGRDVGLEAAERGQREVVESSSPNPWAPRAEEYWPDIEGLDYRNTVTDFDLPEGTFFDCAVVHVVTTATLERLHQLYPQGRFDVRRFRPNVVVDTPATGDDFPENAWVGRTLRLGDGVRLHVDGPCARCVMTTLAQADLPKDSGILRTAARHNGVNVGVYASVLGGGRVVRGNAVTLE
jgi:uncharacterized protein